MTTAPGRQPDQACGNEAPSSPHELTIASDYTGLVLSWRQRGPVDGWTVYCDPLDGTDADAVFIPRRHDGEPTHRFGDLAPGEHHVGVVSWLNGKPSRGADCWAYASVLDQPADAPRIPVLTDLAVTAHSLSASWISQDVGHWHVRLLGSDHSLCQEMDVVDHPYVVLASLVPDTRYGVQVRTVGDDGTPSPWCEPMWAHTSPSTRPERP